MQTSLRGGVPTILRADALLRRLPSAMLHGANRRAQRQAACQASLLESAAATSASVASTSAPDDLDTFFMRALLMSSSAPEPTGSMPVPDELFMLSAAAGERAGGWLGPWVEFLEKVLVSVQDQLDKLHVPYSYGWSIIALTLFVKILSFPLVKQQVESSLAVQTLKPRIDLIKQRFGDDKEKISKETSILYEQAGVNPLAGCLPSLATIPIFIGLFNSLTNVANDGLLDTQGFFWIPSLAGPTSMSERQAGLGMSWLLPLVDGAPPIGWDDAAAYLTLPVLLLVAQYASNAITTPPMDPKDENYNTSRTLMAVLPLMLSWFALNVPAGLSLYYLANTVLTSAIQIYLKKLGGANVKINDLGPVTKPGSGRKLGALASDFVAWKPLSVKTTAEQKAEADAAAAAAEAAEEAVMNGSAPPPPTVSQQEAAAMAAAAAVPLDPATVSRRVKRKKLSLIGGSGVPVAAAPAGSSA